MLWEWIKLLQWVCKTFACWMVAVTILFEIAHGTDFHSVKNKKKNIINVTICHDENERFHSEDIKTTIKKKTTTTMV